MGCNAETSVIGVMRFLQTEWHRHERDRNAWEIERQEMRSRIATLEGSGRRSDAQLKSLRRYVKMLETTLSTERKKAKLRATGVEIPEDEESLAHKVKANRKREILLVFNEHILILAQLRQKSYLTR